MYTMHCFLKLFVASYIFLNEEKNVMTDNFGCNKRTMPNNVFTYLLLAIIREQECGQIITKETGEQREKNQLRWRSVKRDRNM